ncbi:MAG: hypothetical protein BWX88_03971 [Planctomycetes bacterium ADurb.Bin126]|nr:MAG: hypothetical protein BWX88_03971 [Planctomycetes bacterium ADurb.Bin126]
MNAMKRMSSKIGLLVGTLSLVLITNGTAFAHCDTMDGPVVKDAQAALERSDVTGVLKWVPKASEDEIRQMFAKTLVVRAKGPEARELADMYFFETLVRLHRAGEGFAYTGLKPAGTPVPPPVAKADEALAKGSVDEQAAKHKDESVEAGRKFVAAYVQFVHYVEAVHETVMGHGAHHGEPEAETGKQEPQGKPATPAHEHAH